MFLSCSLVLSIFYRSMSIHSFIVSTFIQICNMSLEVLAVLQHESSLFLLRHDIHSSFPLISFILSMSDVLPLGQRVSPLRTEHAQFCLTNDSDMTLVSLSFSCSMNRYVVSLTVTSSVITVDRKDVSERIIKERKRFELFLHAHL